MECFSVTYGTFQCHVYGTLQCHVWNASMSRMKRFSVTYGTLQCHRWLLPSPQSCITAIALQSSLVFDWTETDDWWHEMKLVYREPLVDAAEGQQQGAAKTAAATAGAAAAGASAGGSSSSSSSRGSSSSSNRLRCAAYAYSLIVTCAAWAGAVRWLTSSYCQC